MIELIRNLVKGEPLEALETKLSAAKADYQEARRAVDAAAIAVAEGTGTEAGLAKAEAARDTAHAALKRAQSVMEGAKRRDRDAEAQARADAEAAAWTKGITALDGLVADARKAEALLGQLGGVMDRLLEHGARVWSAPLPPGVRASFALSHLERLVADDARVYHRLAWAGDESVFDGPNHTPKLVETLEAMREAVLSRRPGVEPET